ncbi:hypothetical protein D3C85_1173240 [compost metagenome]
MIGRLVEGTNAYFPELIVKSFIFVLLQHFNCRNVERAAECFICSNGTIIAQIVVLRRITCNLCGDIRN